MNAQTNLNNMELLAIPKHPPYVITSQEMLEIFRSQIITGPRHHPVLKITLNLKK